MGMIIFSALIALIIQIVFSIQFGKLAEEKGYNAFTYGCICFFFGVIGYCMVATLPDLQMQQTLHSITSKLNQLESLLAPKQTATHAAPSQPARPQESVVSKDALAPISSTKDEIICPVCKTKQKSDRRVCWSCGQKFTTTQREASEE